MDKKKIALFLAKSYLLNTFASYFKKMAARR